MDRDEVEACLEMFGSVVFRQSKASQVWSEISDKLFVNVDMIAGVDMVLLNNLLPAVARVNPEKLSLKKSKTLTLEGVSVLGR